MILFKRDFLLDTYYKCTANKTINDKQCTIQWYVDDNKVTHVSEYVITGVINIMKKQYGEFVVSHGKKHAFLRMNTELVKYGEINIGIQSYIKEAIKKIG